MRFYVYLDRPSKPRGPLELTRISANAATLEWEPCEDDGGNPIKHYIVEKMDLADGQWKLVKTVKEPKCEVPELIEGNKYKFRVRAVNDEGESDNLETEKATLARDVCDPPDSPTGLEVTDWDKDHADLQWTPPKRDNGAPITKYVIEAKPKSKGQWAQLKEAREPKARVDLTEGEEYEFRVVAVNKAGDSKPSEATLPIIAKPRFLKPMIDKFGIKPIKVKVGQPVQFELTYRAEPDPSVSWTVHDNKPLVTNLDTVVGFKERSTSVSISNAQRRHTALYTLTVENEVGKDTANLEVVVLGKPSKPIGPLEVTDVTKTSCQLAWKKPEDDGGEEITHYLVEKMDSKKGRWETVSEVTRGTQCPVNRLEEGNRYLFRVTAVSKEGPSEPCETTTETLAKNPFDEPDPPGQVQIVERDSTQIDLKWDPPDNDGGAPISGYIVERKEPKLNRWVKLTAQPVRSCEMSDSTVREGREYEYRVIAINEAGPSEPSKASELALAKPSKEPPKLDTSGLGLNAAKEIRIRAGEPLSLTIPIKGVPKPIIQWSKDGGPTPPGANIVDKEDMTGMNVARAQRSDSGQYKVSLKNDYGEDQANIKVIVIGRCLRV
ncbi:unnamed protein product [Protopolystoma xenopodis]|uniref:Titin n=1 Tax=Protopolystoma xenopodis TaxID=117903 RepID=A0A3S4ZAN2_9PLAT|nr:unnamed protein product [Protopolystoma xenopodis]